MIRLSKNFFFETELKSRADLHVLRKLWHMGTGLIGLVIYFYHEVPTGLMANMLLLIGFLGLFFDFLRLKFQAFNEKVIFFMGAFMRDSEREKLSGFSFYAIGAGLSLYLFDPKIAVLAIFFLIFADPISSYFGVMFGKDKITSNKSIQGCVAGFMVCYLIALFYCLYYVDPSIDIFIFAVFAGLIGCLSEFFSFFIDDNLTIPVISGFGLSALNLFNPIF